MRAILALVLCGVCFAGCPSSQGRWLDVWIVNGTDRDLTGLYACRDPRSEDWGTNLLKTTIPANGVGLAQGVLEPGGSYWIWPYLDGGEFMAHGILCVQEDVRMVLVRTYQGDLKSEVYAPQGAVACARFLTASD